MGNRWRLPAKSQLPMSNGQQMILPSQITMANVQPTIHAACQQNSNCQCTMGNKLFSSAKAQCPMANVQWITNGAPQPNRNGQCPMGNRCCLAAKSQWPCFSAKPQWPIPNGQQLMLLSKIPIAIVQWTTGDTLNNTPMANVQWTTNDSPQPNPNGPCPIDNRCCLPAKSQWPMSNGQQMILLSQIPMCHAQ